MRDRLHAYAEKAIREAAWHTSWNDPDTEFESAVHRWLDAVLDGPVAGELTKLVAKLNPHAASDALGQKLLALTAPGIPDVYQGTELWDDSLVDPDNRRPVDYAGTAGRAERVAAPEDSGRRPRRCGCDAPVRTASCTATTVRCSPPATPAIMWWRSAAATTSWSR